MRSELARCASQQHANVSPLRILNVGAGLRSSIEDAARAVGLHCIIDRTDIVDPTVSTPVTGQCWTAPVESMNAVPSNAYDMVVMNFVLEHIRDIAGAADELHRVLAPGGRLLMTLANPVAPEFIVARLTPTAFHRLFQPNASKTRYRYASITAVTKTFTEAGFSLEAEQRAPVAEAYLRGVHRCLGRVGWWYDEAVCRAGLRIAMGNAYLAFRKI